MFEITKIAQQGIFNLLKFGVALHVLSQTEKTAKVFLRSCFFALFSLCRCKQEKMHVKSKQQKKKWAKFKVLALTGNGRWAATTAIADRVGGGGGPWT